MNVNAKTISRIAFNDEVQKNEKIKNFLFLKINRKRIKYKKKISTGERSPLTKGECKNRLNIKHEEKNQYLSLNESDFQNDHDNKVRRQISEKNTSNSGNPQSSLIHKIVHFIGLV